MNSDSSADGSKSAAASDATTAAVIQTDAGLAQTTKHSDDTNTRRTEEVAPNGVPQEAALAIADAVKPTEGQPADQQLVAAAAGTGVDAPVGEIARSAEGDAVAAAAAAATAIPPEAISGGEGVSHAGAVATLVNPDAASSPAGAEGSNEAGAVSKAAAGQGDAAPSAAPALAAATQSPSMQSLNAKKFTSLSVNKRFLEKAGPTPGAISPSSSKLGGSASPLQAGASLSRLSSPSSASRLTSAKLSSVPKPQPAGWATKTVPAAAKMSPSPSAGSAPSAPPSAGPLPSEVSAPVAGIAAAASPKPASSTALATHPPQITASPRLVTMTREHSPRPLSAGLDAGSTPGRASPGLRNAALGSSIRAASPASVSKAPWANLKTNSSSNLNASGRSMLSDFPTAAEAAKAKQEQEEKAAAAAAREAARQQAALQNLDRFRGTSLGSGKHWDEMEDEDLGEVVEFADGTQYKIPTHSDDKGTKSQGSGPVSKEDRFRDVSHDRSWPPRPTHQASGEKPARAAPPLVWGPQRMVRESSLQGASDPPPRSHNKPEKVVIPLGGASVSLRSPTETREPSYGYGSRERRAPTSYGQASRSDAPPAPTSAAETVTRAVRAWGPLAQRQASLNPGAAPPAPLAAAQSTARSAAPAPAPPHTAERPEGPVSGAASVTNVAAERNRSTAPTSAAAASTTAAEGAATATAPPVTRPVPQVAAATRAPAHLNRPLPPHLARAPAALTEEGGAGRKTSFSPPPEPRRAVATEVAPAPPMRPAWGPRAAAREAVDGLSLYGRAPPAAVPSSIDAKEEVQSAIERARKRRQEEEAERQAEKERARQKALAIEERLKAEAAKKAAEEERRAAEEARQKQNQQPSRAPVQPDRETSPVRKAPSDVASSWRSTREISEVQRPDAPRNHLPPQAAEPAQGDVWRPRGWRSQRPDGATQFQTVNPAFGGRLAAQRQSAALPPMREATQTSAVPTDAGAFTRKTPPHLAAAPQMARRGEPPHLRQQAQASPLPTSQDGRAACWRANRSGEATVGAERGGLAVERPKDEVNEAPLRSPHTRTILAPPNRRSGPPSSSDQRVEAVPESPRQSPEAGGSAEPLSAATDKPKVILSRDSARANAESGGASVASANADAHQLKKSPAPLPPAAKKEAHGELAQPQTQPQPQTQTRSSGREKKARQNAAATETPPRQDIAKPGEERASAAKPRPNLAAMVPIEKPTTRDEIPADRAPVWNKFAVTIRPSAAQPKLNRSQLKAQSARIASINSLVRPVYPLTWDPPMTHLSIKTLSRDDQFFPKKYHRGTVITTVSLPTKTLPRGLPAIVFPTPTPAAEDRLNGAGVRKQARFDLVPVQQSGATASPRMGASGGAAPVSAMAKTAASSGPGPASAVANKLTTSGAPAIQVRLPGQVAHVQSSSELAAAPGAIAESAFSRTEPQRPREDVAAASHFPGLHPKAEARSPFRAAISAATSQSSLGPLDHPRNGVDSTAFTGLSSHPGAGFRQKQRRSSNTPVAFFGDRNLSTPSPVSFMVSSEIKTEGKTGLNATGLSPYTIGGSGRSSSSQTPANTQNSVLPSPSLSSTATWGQSSLTFPVLEPRSSNIADRDHIKNVWSLPTGNDRKETQNSLKDIGDDFLPSAMPLSVHDFRADDASAPDAPDLGSHGGVRGASHPEAGFSDYSRYDANASDGATQNAELSPVGTRSNGFDPTTRSPSLDIASPAIAHPRPSGPGGSHSQGSTPQHRTASAFMPMQSSGNSMSSPTLQHFATSAGASSLHPHDRGQGQTSSAAAAAAAARNAFGAYGGYVQSPPSSSLGSAGALQGYGGAIGGSSHGRPPFGAYGSHGTVNSAPVSPYNGMGRLASQPSQSPSHAHGGGYSLFPMAGQGALGDASSGSGGAAGAGLGVLDSSKIASEPIGYGRAHAHAGPHQGRLHGQLQQQPHPQLQHQAHQSHQSQPQPPQLGGQPGGQNPYAGYPGHWSSGNIAGSGGPAPCGGHPHPSQNPGAGSRAFQQPRQHPQNAAGMHASHGRQQQPPHHHHQQPPQAPPSQPPQQQQHLHHSHQQPHPQQQQQPPPPQQQHNPYDAGQQYGVYGSGAFDPTSRLW